MVEQAKPSIIGHLDLIRKFNTGQKYFSETDSWYRDSVTETLDVIAQSPCILEVNTRGLKHSASGECYPSPWILAECCERDIRIVVNNDAHTQEELLDGVPETIKMLKETGYTEHHVLDVTVWKPQPL